MIWTFQKQEKYKDVEPTAIDLFKECHNSKKLGFSEPVKKAIVSHHLFISFVHKYTVNNNTFHV